jgi:hypothetical protein
MALILFGPFRGGQAGRQSGGRAAGGRAGDAAN